MYLSIESVAVIASMLIAFGIMMAFKEDEVLNAIEKLVNNLYKIIK